ncbi:MAG: AIR synthase-related protein [Bacteroidales bacterium]
MVLTKPIGTGIIISAKKNDLASTESYAAAIANMKQLNANGALVMNKYSIKAATDITGFGLLGHALKWQMEVMSPFELIRLRFRTCPVLWI